MRRPVAPFTSHTWSPAVVGRPVFWGNRSARPAIEIPPASGTRSCFGVFPVRNLKYWTKDCLDVHVWTCVWLGIVTFPAPFIFRPGVPLPAQSARVGTAGLL